LSADNPGNELFNEQCGDFGRYVRRILMKRRILNWLLTMLWMRILLPLVRRIGKAIYDWWRNRKRNVQGFTKVMGALWRSRKRRGW